MKTFIFIFSILLFIACGKNEPQKVEEVNPSTQLNPNQVDISNYKKNIKIETATVLFDFAKYEISFPGNVIPAPDNIYIVSAPVSGRVIKIYKNEGDFVSKGEILLEIESLEFANMISDYIKWKADMNYRKNIVDKLTELSKKKIAPENEYELAKAELKTAQANLQSTSSRLMAIGLSQKDIDELDKSGRAEPIIKIRTQIAGRINEHSIDLGKSVNMYDKMLTVINTEKVMIKGFLPIEDASNISEGSKVKILANNNLRNEIVSNIKSISPALDEQTKSVTVNILVNTIQSQPMPGQMVRLAVDATTPEKVIFIPTVSLMLEGDKNIVFVKVSESLFEKRYVEINKINDQISVVKSGLKEGEQIAVSELFGLKALFKLNEFAD